MGVPYINTDTKAPGAQWGTAPTGAQTFQHATEVWGGTKLADITGAVKNPMFAAYVAEAVHARSQLLRSGVVIQHPALNARMGGIQVEVPTWKTLNPTEEVIESNNTWGASKGGYLTPQHLAATKQVAPILRRGFAYAADDISMMALGVDPLNHLRLQVADALNSLKEKTLFTALAGMFSSTATGVSNLTTDVAATGTTAPAAANYLSAATAIAGKAPLGERADQLRVIAMHSNVYFYLQQSGLLTFSSDSLSSGTDIKWGGGGVGITDTSIAWFCGMRVIVTDNLGPIATGTTGGAKKYPVLMFQEGALAEGFQQELRIESDRNILSKETIVSCDYHYAYHLFGFTWSGSNSNPDAAALGTAANWGFAFGDVKNAGGVRLLVNTPFDTSKYT
jgi:hypothetical protein